jgi:hypothetical protein
LKLLMRKLTVLANRVHSRSESVVRLVRSREVG